MHARILKNAQTPEDYDVMCPIISPSILLRQTLSPNLGLSWWPESPNGHLVSVLPTQCWVPGWPTFYMSFEDLNTGLHVSSASALPTEPFSQSVIHYRIKKFIFSWATLEN